MEKKRKPLVPKNDGLKLMEELIDLVQLAEEDAQKVFYNGQKLPSVRLRKIMRLIRDKSVNIRDESLKIYRGDHIRKRRKNKKKYLS